METITSGGSGEGPRNKRGQWVPGMSGNRNGRPRKMTALPKSLGEHLADAMMEKIPLIDGEGKKEMVPAYVAVASQLVRKLTDLNAKDLITTMRWMDGQHVYDELRKRAGNEPEKLTLEQAKARVKARLAELAEEQSERE